MCVLNPGGRNSSQVHTPIPLPSVIQRHHPHARGAAGTHCSQGPFVHRRRHEVAFRFINQDNFYQALVRSVEGAVRSVVATKRQTEIHTLRSEIVGYVKNHIDESLATWGYHLIDVQLNDIVFDKPVMDSMAQVVASKNMLAAAENEGQALLIRKTREAEAEGNAVRISAEAERTAQQARGQGIALFREEAAKGISHAAKEVQDAGLGPSLILFQMWTESVRHIAEHGRGNTIFLDGSVDGMHQTMRQIQSLETQRLQRGD